MIPRQASETLIRYSKGFPAICITGPRQSGKTTLARMTFPDKPYRSLEDPDLQFLVRSDPRGFLDTWPEGLIIDEAQYVPELFPYLKSYIDEDPSPGKYIITGSQQFNLMEKITESLAGRAAFLTLLPFSIKELSEALPSSKSKNIKMSPMENPYEKMLKGLYPPLYDRNLNTYDFYSAYILSYIERDLRHILNVQNLSSFQRFISFCAARIGSMVNLSSLALDCGITHNTAKAWLSILEISGLVYLLKPYYRNCGKRLVKSPKLYFTDTGLACHILGISSDEQLFLNPQRGPLFEGFIISEILKDYLNNGQRPNIWFYRDNSGLEIDCLLEDQGNLTALEIKSGKTFSEDMLQGIKRWQKITGTTSTNKLIYGGLFRSSIDGISIVPWNGFTN